MVTEWWRGSPAVGALNHHLSSLAVTAGETSGEAAFSVYQPSCIRDSNIRHQSGSILPESMLFTGRSFLAHRQAVPAGVGHWLPQTMQIHHPSVVKPSRACINVRPDETGKCRTFVGASLSPFARMTTDPGKTKIKISKSDIRLGC